MSLPFPISSTQTDAKSPVDDNLMDSIREDLDFLDDVITAGGVPTYVWTINGILTYLPGRVAKRIDMQFLHVEQIFSRLRVAQDESGSSGITEVDIRYHTNPKTPIAAIAHQFSDSTQSIGQLGSALNTQAVTLATVAVATQTITRAKTQLSVLSIIGLGSNKWRYNLSAAPDSAWLVGDSVTIAACTNALNNGQFTLVEVNKSGYASIVVTNASGVAQTAAAGTVDLDMFSYNLVNPANSNFAAGELATFASHTNGGNNGNKTIYAINTGGNNIWVKNASGATQGGVAGTCTCNRWIYTYSASVPSRYAVGEKARFASHTTGGNNGDFLIVALNTSGNNITVYNTSGAVQAGAVGTVNTLRWKYSFAGDPSAQVSVGHTVVMASHTAGANNGTFTVVDVNDTTANNFSVYNASGVLQAGVAGTVVSTKKLVKFDSDQSTNYTTASYIEMKECVDSTYNARISALPFKVLEVNRGGGANYNVVIDVPTGAAQASPSGFIDIEGRSIMLMADGSKPQVAANVVGLTTSGMLRASYTSTDIMSTAVPANTYLGLYVLRTQAGAPKNLSVMLS